MDKELRNNVLKCFVIHFKAEQDKYSYLFEGLESAFQNTFAMFNLTDEQKKDFMFYVKANIRLR